MGMAQDAGRFSQGSSARRNSPAFLASHVLIADRGNNKAAPMEFANVLTNSMASHGRVHFYSSRILRTGVDLLGRSPFAWQSLLRCGSEYWDLYLGCEQNRRRDGSSRSL